MQYSRTGGSQRDAEVEDDVKPVAPYGVFDNRDGLQSVIAASAVNAEFGIWIRYALCKLVVL